LSYIASAEPTILGEHRGVFVKIWSFEVPLGDARPANEDFSLWDLSLSLVSRLRNVKEFDLCTWDTDRPVAEELWRKNAHGSAGLGETITY
jgi:hypothetical protein